MELLAMKNAISESATWGRLAEPLYVHELAPPTVAGPLERSQESVGCVYFGRTLLLIRVSGGMLVTSPRQLVAELASAGRKLRAALPSPAAQLRQTVSWLEELQRDGHLRRSYSTASIILIVSSEEVWAWHVGPHGTFAGTIEKLSLQSTDARMPVLYERGVPRPAVRPPDSDLRDKATSVFSIGSPVAYECIRHEVGPDTALVEVDRGTFPFGPLSDRSWSLNELCGADAGWRHGLPGRTLVVGRMQRLELPAGWEMQTTTVTDG